MSVGHLTDRMPEVARLATAWTDEEVAHLEACRECAAEWRVVVLAHSSRSPMPPLDSEALAAGALRRLRTGESSLASLAESRRPGRWRPLIGLAAAAALVLAVALRGPAAPDPTTAVAPVREPTMLPELDGLLLEELEVLLATIETDQVLDEPIGPLPRLGDLTESELELLLKEMEG